MKKKSRSTFAALLGLKTITAPHPHQRGAALVIALFSLLMITGMGIIAIQTSTQEIQSAGNFKLNKQAEYVSGGALNVVLGEVSQNGDTYWNFMKQGAYQQAADEGGTAADITKAYTFQNGFINSSFMLAQSGDINSATLPPNMSVKMDNPLDGQKVPGFSDEFCFKRFRFSAQGSLGTPPASELDINLEDPNIRYAEFHHQAYGLLGPIDCEGN